MKSSRKTMVLAVCAVFAAVATALNFIASLHIVRLDVIFYVVSGALVYFVSMRFGAGSGAALYAAASILSFLLVPDKVWILFFIGVFGPAAVLQSVFEKHMGKNLSATLTVVTFILLFYIFGVVFAYGGGFIPLIGLPEGGSPGSLYLAFGFAAFSAIVARLVNRGLYFILARRFGNAPGMGAPRSGNPGGAAKNGGIVLPKLWEENKDDIQ